MEYQKVAAFCGLVLWSALVWSQGDSNAITTENPLKHTLIERFEPELALTTKAREEWKAERFAEINAKLRILDTMNISDHKRKQLMDALLADPLSTELDKVFVEIELEN